MKRTFIVAAAATAVLAAPASAAVHYKRFVSPTGKIRCYAVKFGGNGIECFADYIKEIGELDTYVTVEKRGKARFGERGDFPGFPNARERTLRYGATWKRKGVTCKMRESGLTCTNADDHGFHLAKGDVRTF